MGCSNSRAVLLYTSMYRRPMSFLLRSSARTICSRSRRRTKASPVCLPASVDTRSMSWSASGMEEKNSLMSASVDSQGRPRRRTT